MRKGALYEIRCMGCKSLGKEMVYVGETARSCFDRGLEHWRALETSNQESPLVENCYQDHDDQRNIFQMMVKDFPRTTML